MIFSDPLHQIFASMSAHCAWCVQNFSSSYQFPGECFDLLQNSSKLVVCTVWVTLQHPNLPLFSNINFLHSSYCRKYPTWGLAIWSTHSNTRCIYSRQVGFSENEVLCRSNATNIEHETISNVYRYYGYSVGNRVHNSSTSQSLRADHLPMQWSLRIKESWFGWLKYSHSKNLKWFWRRTLKIWPPEISACNKFQCLFCVRVNGERGLFSAFQRNHDFKSSVPAIMLVKWQNKVETTHHKRVGCTLHSAASKMSISPIYAHTK